MYSTMLATHSVVRWVVLLAGLVAVARALSGLRTAGRWTPSDDLSGRLFTVSLDIQVLLGLVLYGVLSPVTAAALGNLGAAMDDPLLRYWAVEHIAGMIVAVALAHVGRVRIRRALDTRSRHRTAAVFFGLALLAIVVSIPWPGLAVGRPIFPGL